MLFRSRLRDQLAQVGFANLETAVRRIGTELEPWTPGLTLPMKVAMSLMAAGWEKATSGVRAFRKELASLEEVMTLIATSWIDCRAATELGTMAEKPGMLALNGSQSRTAVLYVQGACDLPVNDSWKVVQVDGAIGNGGIEELKRLVRSALSFRLGVELSEVDEEISKFTKREPLFIALPLGGLRPAALRELRMEFPNLSFFLLTGDQHLPEEFAQQADLQVLHPPLEPGSEQRFWKAHDDSLNYLKKMQ